MLPSTKNDSRTISNGIAINLGFLILVPNLILWLSGGTGPGPSNGIRIGAAVASACTFGLLAFGIWRRKKAAWIFSTLSSCAMLLSSIALTVNAWRPIEDTSHGAAAAGLVLLRWGFLLLSVLLVLPVVILGWSWRSIR